jgi:hypothetical protein
VIRRLPFAAWPLLALAAVPAADAAEGERPGPPVAIVEDVAGAGGVARLDLLREGHVIDLGGDGRVVLGYLRSCRQDSVTGGRVVVEAQASRVEGGALVRRRVECDAAGLLGAAAPAPSSRPAPPEARAPAAAEPDIVLFGRSPIVVLPSPGTLVIERLDFASAPVRIEAAGDRIDLADHGVALGANGLYRATAGAAGALFRVDILAESGRAPAAGRLLPLR